MTRQDLKKLKDKDLIKLGWKIDTIMCNILEYDTITLKEYSKALTPLTNAKYRMLTKYIMDHRNLLR